MDSSAGAVYTKLEASRKELLDLGLRNPLLNYRLLRARGVEIVDELSEEVFRILVQNKKAMSFLPAPNEEDSDDQLLLIQPEEESEPGKPAARHVDHRLQTPHSSSQLQSRLLKTYGVARTFIEERGVNALFLAMGMLNWYESDSSQVTRRAPLILVPVSLERATANERFRVSYTEQDIGENLSLSAKLKAEFGMALPQLPDIEDLDIQTYFNDIEQAVRSEKRWSIDHNALAIGFFSFGKFLMYHDLDVTRWPQGTNPLGHPILRALLQDGFSEASSEFNESDQIDKHMDPATVHHVMDADSSQILAILDVIRGRNLVIQGPPGTGKSQTITNLIAETVGAGKTVLFVAEKMAALEVVKRRLDNIGLGEACLELHSHKTQKRGVLDELRKTLNLGKPKLLQSANDLEMLRSMRDRLNSYCEAINTPIGLSEVIPYQAYGELIKLQKRLGGITVPNLGLNTIHTWDGPTFARRQALIEELQNHIKIAGSPKDNPFWGTRRTVFLPTEQARMRDALLAARQAVINLRETSSKLADSLGLNMPKTRAQSSVSISTGERTLDAPDLRGVAVRSQEWLSQRNKLSDLLRAGALLADLHRQYDSEIRPDAWSGEQLYDAMSEARDMVLTLQEYSAVLARALGLESPKTRVAAELQVLIARCALNAPRLRGTQVKSEDWQYRSSELQEALAAGVQLASLHEQHDAVLSPDVWNQDLIETRQSLDLYGRRWTGIFSNSYRKARRKLKAMCRGSMPKEIDAQLALIDIVQKAQLQQNILRKHEALAAGLFGEQWLGEQSDWPQLAELADWLRQLHFDVSGKRTPKAVLDFMDENPDTKAPVEEVNSVEMALMQHTGAVGTLANLCRETPPQEFDKQTALFNAVRAAQGPQDSFQKYGTLGSSLFGTQWQDLESNWIQLVKVLEWLYELHTEVSQGKVPEAVLGFLDANPDLRKLRSEISAVEQAISMHSQAVPSAVDPLEIDMIVRFGTDREFKDQAFEIQEEIFSEWSSRISELHSIATFNNYVTNCGKEGMSNLAEIAATWPDASQYLVAAFRYKWFETQLEQAYRERPILTSFSRESQEHTISRFRELDELSIEYNRAKLANIHWNKLPAHDAGGQLGILRREFVKKSRHIHIRQLMINAGNAVQAIKPVFMMSPQSVASFLTPGGLKFDLIIFDEASQVKPVDAFGALLRGNQAVVVGDMKQLPPTNFFDSLTQADESDEDDVTGDIESILGLFVAQGAPERMLKWHYRSRHESLIAISNYEFYGNRLIVFPSPVAAREEMGLVYHYLPNTSYDRGKSRTNVEEAKTVANAVMSHARMHPKLTLGVAAFSVAQMQAIMEQLEILRRQDPTCENFFTSNQHEPFFVKNLENVQGDERDVILISIGYGRTAEGYLAMDFGPLNRQGGERRLNVLITRARRRCEVFTNLTADDIDLNRSDARGVRALKTFLSYAQNGKLDVPIATGREPDSPFEEAVMSALTDLGYQVHPQVGSAGFFIDIAVVDPKQPGRYLLGIECDGATYHSARSARDRDRLRQQVLENLGWRIHRIWSTDWFRDPQRELKRVVTAIEEAKAYMPTAPRKEESAPSKQITQMERDSESSETAKSLSLPEYEMAKLSVRTYGWNFEWHTVEDVASWAAEVVQVESPVHKSEVARRIADAAGIGRIGSRIQAAIDRGCSYTIHVGTINEKNNFLWSLDMKRPVPRDRNSLPVSSRKLALVAPEEIAEVVIKLVASSYGIGSNDIPPAVCRLLGFGRASDEMRSRVNSIISEMIRNKRLIKQGEHLIVSSTGI